MTIRGARSAALAMAGVALLGAGCSSGSKASSTTTTTKVVTLAAATRIVERSTDVLSDDQVGPLLDHWCAAARSGDRTQLVSDLRVLAMPTDATLDEVLGALEKGADAYCPADTSGAPDLLSSTHDDLAATASPANVAPSTTLTLPTTTAPARSPASHTTTTVHHATATTAAPATTAPPSSTTSTTNLCSNIGGSDSGVVVGGGGASSCSRSGSG